MIDEVRARLNPLCIGSSFRTVSKGNNWDYNNVLIPFVSGHRFERKRRALELIELKVLIPFVSGHRFEL